MMWLTGPFSGAFEGSNLVLLLSAGTRESLPVSFGHLRLIEMSFLTASHLPMSFLFILEPEQLFLSPALATARGLLGCYLWMSPLK